LGVHGAKDRDKMIFECADGTFSSVGSMFTRRDTLEGDLVAKKGVLEVLGTFVVENVQVDGMTLTTNLFVAGFPGVTNGSSLLVGKCHGVDRVGVLVVQNKNVQVSATGRNRKVTSLIRIGFENFLVREQHATKVVRFGSGWRSGVISIVWSRSNVVIFFSVGGCFGGS
jgi:hypothetical protein